MSDAFRWVHATDPASQHEYWYKVNAATGVHTGESTWTKPEDLEREERQQRFQRQSTLDQLAASPWRWLTEAAESVKSSHEVRMPVLD